MHALRPMFVLSREIVSIPDLTPFLADVEQKLLDRMLCFTYHEAVNIARCRTIAR